MSEAESTLYQLQGLLSAGTPDIQQATKVAYDEIKAIIEKHKEYGILGLTLFTLELAVAEEKRNNENRTPSNHNA